MATRDTEGRREIEAATRDRGDGANIKMEYEVDTDDEYVEIVSREIEAAKQRLAAAKAQTSAASKMLKSAKAAEESAKATEDSAKKMAEMANKNMQTAITNRETAKQTRETAQLQAESFKKEMEEAMKFLKEAEDRGGEIAVNCDGDAEGTEPSLDIYFCTNQFAYKMGQFQTAGLIVQVADNADAAEWDCTPISVSILPIPFPSQAAICGKAWYEDDAGGKIVAQAGISEIFCDNLGFAFNAQGKTVKPEDLRRLYDDDGVYAFETKFVPESQAPAAIVARSNVGVYWGVRANETCAGPTGGPSATIYADKTLFFFEEAVDEERRYVGITILGSAGENLG